MSPYQWILVTLAALPVIVSIWRYWKPSFPRSPPPLPPITSLQGMPPELRNLVYGFLAINTSLRIISGKKLVAAYQALHSERRPKLERTGLKWHVAGTPMANIKVPIIDLTPLLPAATSRYPLDSVSRQLRAEVPPLVDTFGASEYLFILNILNNFDLKQMELIAGSIRALDNEARQRDPPVTFDYHMCFVTDDDAVSSAEKLCLYLEENGKVPRVHCVSDG